MKKPSFIKRFFSFLLRVCVVLALMAVIAVGSFEGVTYYLTGSFTSVKKAVKEETDQQEVQEDTIDIIKNNKNMENTLVFVHDENTNKDYTSLNMYDKKTKAFDVLLMPCDAQVSVSESLVKELRETISDISSTVSMSDVARAFGDKKYETYVKIMEDISGVKISGYAVMSSNDFKKLLNAGNTVTYHLDHAVSYRDADNVLQSIEAGDVELDSDTAYALMTYMDGTDDEETRRLERANDYLTKYMEEIFTKNNNSALAKKYDSLVKAENTDDLTSTEDILKGLTEDGFTLRIMQGSETKGVFSLDSQKVKLQVAALTKQNLTQRMVHQRLLQVPLLLAAQKVLRSIRLKFIMQRMFLVWQKNGRRILKAKDTRSVLSILIRKRDRFPRQELMLLKKEWEKIY